ncbi:hypothetical protein [Ensifer adhaerens]
MSDKDATDVGPGLDEWISSTTGANLPSLAAIPPELLDQIFDFLAPSDIFSLSNSAAMLKSKVNAHPQAAVAIKKFQELQSLWKGSNGLRAPAAYWDWPPSARIGLVFILCGAFLDLDFYHRVGLIMVGIIWSATIIGNKNDKSAITNLGRSLDAFNFIDSNKLNLNYLDDRQVGNLASNILSIKMESNRAVAIGCVGSIFPRFSDVHKAKLADEILNVSDEEKFSFAVQCVADNVDLLKDAMRSSIVKKIIGMSEHEHFLLVANRLIPSLSNLDQSDQNSLIRKVLSIQEMSDVIKFCTAVLPVLMALSDGIRSDIIDVICEHADKATKVNFLESVRNAARPLEPALLIKLSAAADK